MRPLTGRCLLGLGRLCASRGDDEGARIYLRQAGEIFDELGLSLWGAEAEAAYGRLASGT
jgi:hypothetical protein